MTTKVTAQMIDAGSARGNITQHATTMDFFAVTSPDILDGTGSAVTITACVNAPQAGATRKFYPIVATVLTHGATFDIAGNANLTAAAGDCWIIEAKTVSTYRVTAVKEDGTAVVVAASPFTAKAWINFSGDGTTINGSLNVTSLTDTGTGNWKVNLTTPFSSANYCAVANGNPTGNGSSYNRAFGVSAQTTSTFTIIGKRSLDDAAIDSSTAVNAVAFGDQ